jgi:hypothetical protein
MTKSIHTPVYVVHLAVQCYLLQKHQDVLQDLLKALPLQMGVFEQ